MSDNHLTVENLAVRFGAARVLESVSLQVRAGCLVGFVGANGAGKTTTLRAISGVVARQKGLVRLGAEEVPSDPAQAARMGIAHVPEGRGLISSFSVYNNLRLALAAQNRHFKPPHWEHAVSVFPALKQMSDRQAGFLSGGEQQMVAIARGLIVRPKILMVDELSLGLAPKIVSELLETLSHVAASEKVGILLVDQNVRALSRVSTNLYTLSHGRSVEVAPDDDNLHKTAFFG
jgi:branched-chain amino acid transport system ATP-binding protein